MKFKIAFCSLLSLSLAAMHDVRVKMPDRDVILSILATDNTYFDDQSDNDIIADSIAGIMGSQSKIQNKIFNIFGQVKRGSRWSVEYSNMVNALMKSAEDVDMKNDRTPDNYNR